MTKDFSKPPSATSYIGLPTLLGLLALGFLVRPNLSDAAEQCFYTDSSGMFRTSSPAGVPAEYKSSARCEAERVRRPKVPAVDPRKRTLQEMLRQLGETPPSAKGGAERVPSQRIRANTKRTLSVTDYSKHLKNSGNYISKNDQIKLSNNSRSFRMNTDLGIANIRWERSAEQYFNGPVDRTIGKAFKAATKQLARSAFPSKLRQSDFEWSFVVVDKDSKLPSKPNTGGCHPGWMTPPAQIVLDAYAIATGCGRSRQQASKPESTELLHDTTLHEIGHAVEFHLLEGAFGLKERWHSEGFASWFETQGASSSARARSKQIAKTYYRPDWNPRTFNGSAIDYKKAYAILDTIEKKRGLQRLSDVYKKMSQSNMRMLPAIKEVLGWDKKKLGKMVSDHLDQ